MKSTASPDTTIISSLYPPLVGHAALSPTYLVAVMNLYLGNRRSMSSSSNVTAAPPVKDDFPEALTYRYNENSAWVPAARSHEVTYSLSTSLSVASLTDGPMMVMLLCVQEAIDLAKHAYPELRSIRRDRITFHTTGKSSIACITPAAWQLVVRRLPPYHVVDVRIRDMDGLEADAAELPEYSYSAASAVQREKGFQQKEEQQHPSTGPGSGNRLRRVMSFVRGSDS